jgi:ATP-dependent DNA ligase
MSFNASSHKISGLRSPALASAMEGIVSKRKGSLYRSDRSPDWLKSKNPACEAVRREAEEDWSWQPL